MSAKKKETRNRFRSDVFSRDKHTCKIPGCGKPAADAHHITDRTEMPEGGYVKENGISLCSECHVKAEVWHSSNKTTLVLGFMPDDLYGLIGSSYQKALEASTVLSTS